MTCGPNYRGRSEKPSSQESVGPQNARQVRGTYDDALFIRCFGAEPRHMPHSHRPISPASYSDSDADGFQPTMREV
jgi:hypothetical protein